MANSSEQPQFSMTGFEDDKSKSQVQGAPQPVGAVLHTQSAIGQLGAAQPNAVTMQSAPGGMISPTNATTAQPSPQSPQTVDNQTGSMQANQTSPGQAQNVSFGQAQSNQQVHSQTGGQFQAITATTSSNQVLLATGQAMSPNSSAAQPGNMGMNQPQQLNFTGTSPMQSVLSPTPMGQGQPTMGGALNAVQSGTIQTTTMQAQQAQPAVMQNTTPMMPNHSGSFDNTQQQNGSPSGAQPDMNQQDAARSAGSAPAAPSGDSDSRIIRNCIPTPAGHVPLLTVESDGQQRLLFPTPEEYEAFLDQMRELKSQNHPRIQSLLEGLEIPSRGQTVSGAGNILMQSLELKAHDGLNQIMASAFAIKNGAGGGNGNGGNGGGNGGGAGRGSGKGQGRNGGNFSNQNRHDNAAPMDGEEDTRTTMMLRNIPNKYTQPMLLKTLDEHGFEREYDFFYLPIDFRNRCNVGYAFINFVSNPAAKRFYEMFHKYKLKAYNSPKVCEVNYARVQGLEANIEVYRNSPVNGIPIKQYRPLIFKNGSETDFPQPDAPLPPIQLRECMGKDGGNGGHGMGGRGSNGSSGGQGAGGQNGMGAAQAGGHGAGGVGPGGSPQNAASAMSEQSGPPAVNSGPPVPNGVQGGYGGMVGGYNAAPPASYGQYAQGYGGYGGGYGGPPPPAGVGMNTGGKGKGKRGKY